MVAPEVFDPIGRVVFEHSPDAIFVESLDGTVIEVNPAACRLHAATREQLIGSSVFDLVPPDDREAVVAKFPLLARGQIDRIEGHSWTADGRRVPIELQASRIVYKDEPALLLIVRDVSERHKAADELRRERAALRGVAEANPLSTFFLDADGVISFASEQAETLFRLPLNRIIGSHYRDAIFEVFSLDGTRLPADQLPAHAVLTEGRSVHEQRLMLGLPGGERRRICVNGSPLRDAEGGVAGGVFVVEDVTERDRIADELVEAGQRYRDLVNSVDAIVWEVDLSSMNFTFVSHQAEKILGYPVAQWTECFEFWLDHIHPEDRDRVWNYCRETTEAGMDHEMEYRMIASDGSIVWLRDLVRVICDSSGSPVKLRGLMIDTTQSRRSAERLRALLNELNHRIRNNLASMLSLIELYQAGNRSAESLAMALRSQVGAMAAAHNHIAESHGEPIRLDRLAHSLGGQFAAGSTRRLHLDGPPCHIDPARVAAITIIIQEWITNSSKHGALSNGTGKAYFQWGTTDCSGSPDCLQMSWTESGGPSVKPPAQVGVGLSLIRGFAEYELKGECVFDFDPSGFGCRICLPGVSIPAEA